MKWILKKRKVTMINQKDKTVSQVLLDRRNALQSEISWIMNKRKKMGAQEKFMQFMYANQIALMCAKLEEVKLMQKRFGSLNN